MSGVTSYPSVAPYEVKRYNATNESTISKLVDTRALWEAFPQRKDYMYLDPAVKTIAQWSKEGLLLGDGGLFKVFEKEKKVVYTSAENVRWKLYIEGNDLRGTVMKVDYEEGEKLGKAGQEFSIWLDTEWFGDRDVLMIDEIQEAPFVIRSMGPDGHLWEYRVKLLEDGYINADEIIVGDRVTQIGALRGEAADQRGTVSFTLKENSCIEFSVPMTEMGWELGVTDKAWNAMVRNNEMYCICPEQKGGLKDMITVSMLDMKFMKATDRQIDLWLTYGKGSGKYTSKHLDNLTNRHLRHGPGFYDFLRFSRQEWFNPNSFSIDFLANLFSSIWDKNVQPKDRVVYLGTGTYGLELWRKAIQAYGGLNDSLIFEDFDINYDKENNGYDGMRTGLVANKKQIVGLFLPDFGKIIVKYLPHLDDTRIEKRKYKGRAIRSGEFIALDYGMGNGDKSNIYIVKDKGENGFFYGVGTWTPLGPIKNGSNLRNRYAHTEGAKREYKLYRDESFALVVKDPSRIVWLRPAIK